MFHVEHCSIQLMHYYNRHIGDYAKDTGHLTLLEHGVYTVLLDWAYATERSLPDDNDAVYRICRATTALEKKAVERVVLEFFPAVDGKRTNNRASLEIFEFHTKSEKNRSAAGKRWQTKGNADAVRTHSERIATRARVPSSDSQNPKTDSQQQAAAEIPSDEEVRTWAEMAGVDPDYASHQWEKTTDDQTWLRNGKLADWKNRWLGFWLEDRESWMKKKSPHADKKIPGAPPNPAVKIVATLERSE